jgi:hypothetical protein
LVRLRIHEIIGFDSAEKRALIQFGSFGDDVDHLLLLSVGDYWEDGVELTGGRERKRCVGWKVEMKDIVAHR